MHEPRTLAVRAQARLEDRREVDEERRHRHHRRSDEGKVIRRTGLAPSRTVARRWPAAGAAAPGQRDRRAEREQHGSHREQQRHLHRGDPEQRARRPPGTRTRHGDDDAPGCVRTTRPVGQRPPAQAAPARTASRRTGTASATTQQSPPGSSTQLVSADVSGQPRRPGVRRAMSAARRSPRRTAPVRGRPPRPRRRGPPRPPRRSACGRGARNRSAYASDLWPSPICVAGVDVEQPQRLQQRPGAVAQGGLDVGGRDAASTTSATSCVATGNVETAVPRALRPLVRRGASRSSSTAQVRAGRPERGTPAGAARRRGPTTARPPRPTDRRAPARVPRRVLGPRGRRRSTSTAAPRRGPPRPRRPS